MKTAESSTSEDKNSRDVQTQWETVFRYVEYLSIEEKEIFNDDENVNADTRNSIR